MSDQLPLDQWVLNRVAVSAKFASDFNILYTQYLNGATCILSSSSEEYTRLLLLLLRLRKTQNALQLPVVFFFL